MMGGTWLSNLDPRAKLAVALAYTLVVALGQRPGPGIMALAASFALYILSRQGMGLLLRRAFSVNLFVAFLWLFLPWRLDWGGGPVWRYHPEGLALAELITYKVNAIFLMTLALLRTSRPTELIHGLAHFHLPAKLLALAMLFYRYVHVIMREYWRLRMALKVRCFKPGNNLHTYRTFAYLVGMLLVRSLDRAERIHQAMLCRGFTGTYWLLDHFRWHRRDTLFVLVSGAGLAALAVLGWRSASWS